MSCADEAWWPTGAGLSLVMPFLLSGLGAPLFLPFAYLEQMAVGVAEKTADLSSPQSCGEVKNAAPRDTRTSYAARQSGTRIVMEWLTRRGSSGGTAVTPGVSSVGSAPVTKSRQLPLLISPCG
jgi:hypothetical protein